ncbi:hypothetical protein RB595_005157 [Gaeumannomyces hyphopodioides]
MPRKKIKRAGAKSPARTVPDGTTSNPPSTADDKGTATSTHSYELRSLSRQLTIKPVVDEVLRERRSEAEDTAGKKRKRLGRTESNRDRGVRLQEAMQSLVTAIPQEVDPPDADAQSVQNPPTPDDQEMAEAPAEERASPEVSDENATPTQQLDSDKEVAEWRAQEYPHTEGLKENGVVQQPENREEVDEEKGHDHTCTDDLNEDPVTARTPEQGHQEPETEEEQIQTQLRRDMPSPKPSDEDKSPAETSQHAAPTPPEKFSGPSAEVVAKVEHWRRIAEAAALSHLRLKVPIAAQQANTGSCLLSHDGLQHHYDKAETRPLRANAAVQQHQPGGPGIVCGNPRTPERRAQTPPARQDRSVMLASPVNIKVETPSTISAARAPATESSATLFNIKVETPSTIRSVRVTPATASSATLTPGTARSATLSPEVFYTPRSSFSPSKRPRLE